MGIITLKIDDDVESQFRRKASETYGLKRGALSRAAQEALERWSRGAEIIQEEPVARTFVALMSGRVVVAAPTLRELGKRLKARRLDPRQVEIQTRPPQALREYLGLRTSRRAQLSRS